MAITLPSMEKQAATDTDRLARDPPPLLGGQKRHHGRDVLHLPDARGRGRGLDERLERVEEVLVAAVVAVRRDGPRVDAVHRDAPGLAQFGGPDARQGLVRGFAGRVHGLLRHAHAGRDGGDDDDASAAGHVFDGLLREEDGCFFPPRRTC